MKTLAECYTVPDVEQFIEELTRNMSAEQIADIREKAESHQFSDDERTPNSKLDLMVKALERRDELSAEIRSGRRSPDGMLHISV